MGTLIQLLILNLNGTVIDVALAITLFNAVGVPAALVWGFVTDRFHKRKLILGDRYYSCFISVREHRIPYFIGVRGVLVRYRRFDNAFKLADYGD